MSNPATMLPLKERSTHSPPKSLVRRTATVALALFAILTVAPVAEVPALVGGELSAETVQDWSGTDHRNSEHSERDWETFKSWAKKQILKLGIKAALTQLLGPVTFFGFFAFPEELGGEYCFF